MTCISNIKDVRCKARLHDLHDVAGVCPPCCAASFFYFVRWAQALVIHTASHVDREKRVAWFSMRACSSLPIIMVLRLAAFQAAGAPLLCSS